MCAYLHNYNVVETAHDCWLHHSKGGHVVRAKAISANHALLSVVYGFCYSFTLLAFYWFPIPHNKLNTVEPNARYCTNKLDVWPLMVSLHRHAC